MDKSLIKKIMWGLGLASLCLTAQLPAFFGNDCCEDGPLSCNALGVQVKGGVTPSHFTHRGRVLMFNPSLPIPVIEGSSRAKFNDLFDTPWQVGVELDWNASSHVQFFAEYVYEQFKGKHRHFVNGALDFHQRHGDIANNSFYLGARYFFGSIWCDDCLGSLSPFVGFKAGFKWQESNNYHLEVNGVDLGTFRFNHNQAAVSTGLQLGFDWAVNCNWGIVLTGEAVLTQGFRASRNNIVESDLIGGVTNVILPSTGRIVSYPVTLGLRYTF